MRLHLLAKDPASDVGGCPSVHEWMDGPADDPECVVQGPIVGNEHLPDVLPGEGGVRIKRSILIEAMRGYLDGNPKTPGELIPPDAPEFQALFDRFEHSVFRLETLQTYQGSRERDLLAEFLAGRPRPADRVKADWTAMIAANVRAGKTVQRVHVVREPLTDYLRFELTWGYEPNAQAGEDIRIVPVHDDWPHELPQHDYWLFDAATLYEMHYDADGTWLGIEHVTDPAVIVEACAWRDAALHLGIPWQSYVRDHPGLAEHLSFGRAR